MENHPVHGKDALESVRTSGGAYKISAPRGLHDDYATVLALLAYKAENSKPPRELHVHALNMKGGADFGWGPPSDREPGSRVTDDGSIGWEKIC